MVYLSLADTIPVDATEIVARLKEQQVLVGKTGKRRFRLVTHYWVDDQAVQNAVGAFAEVLRVYS
jgi:threonine aldolase